VKLLAPATGAPGFGGLFGEFTAGVPVEQFVLLLQEATRRESGVPVRTAPGYPAPRRIASRSAGSTGDIRRKATETYDQASEQVNNIVTKGRQAVDRGREAFESARQSAASQTTGGNGTTSDFGTPGRSGVSDFNSGTRTTGGA